MAWQDAYPAASGIRCGDCKRLKLFWGCSYTFASMVLQAEKQEWAIEFAEDSG